MPQLDPNRARYVDTDHHEVRASPITPVVVAPYQPLKATAAKVQLPSLHTTVRFTDDNLSETETESETATKFCN